MIAGATRGAGGAALGSHLGKAVGNEEVRTLEGRGLVSQGIRDQVAELTRMGSHARTRTPLYHLHADPPPGKPWTPEERAEYWDRLEAEFGLQGRPFAAVMHRKEGRDHEHRVYLRVRSDGTAIRLDHDHARREKLGRIFEHDRGDPLTKGAHNRAVLHALDRERPDVAAAVRAAGLHEGPPARAALSPEQRAIQERRQGTATKAGMAAQVAQAWAASDGQEAFAAALADAGLRLACGDRKAVPVVVDGQGRAHELARLFAAHAKASGEPVPGKEAMAGRIDLAVLTRAAELPALGQGEAAPVHDHEAAAPALDAGAAALVPGQPPAVPKPQAPAPVTATPAPVPEAPAVPAEQPAAGGPSRDGQESAGNVAKTPGCGGGGGASLESAGDAPAPLKHGASPDERAKHIAAWAAYEDRKAQAWARWIASWEASARKAAPTAGAGGGQGHGDVQQQAAEAGAEAVRRLLDHLREQWDRARSVADLRAAVTAFEAEAARIRAAAGIAPAPGPAAGHEHGDDRAAGRGGPQDGRHDSPDARAGGGGRGDAGGTHVSPGWRGAATGGGPGGGRGDGRGEPGADGGAPGAPGGQARQALEAAAAAARLAHALAAVPEPAMARLRRAAAALRPGAAAAARVRADRDAIAAVLGTHPHPDPADRDPVARATLYAGRLSDGYRERKAAVELAQAVAMAAMKGRGVRTRMLHAMGIPTGEQRRADAAGVHALALTDEEERLRPTPEAYAHARADGAAHAYAARADTATWEERPEVREALEQARLNEAVDHAAAKGDPAVSRALRAGDPEAARAVVQEREEAERRRQEELARRMGMHPPGEPAAPMGGGPRPPGMR